MVSAEHATSFIAQAVQTAVFFWPVSLLLVVSLLVYLMVWRDWANAAFVRRVAWLVALGVASVAILGIVTALFERPSARAVPPEIGWPGVLLVVGVTLAHLSVGIGIVVRSPTRRVPVAVVMFVTLWLVACAAFVAFFEVSGAASL
jgi:hypothetical protein